MKRSKLRNDYLNYSNEENRLACKKQRYFWVTLLRKKKTYYLNNLDLNLVRDNKMFWKTISPYFVNNSKKRSKITLVDEKIILYLRTKRLLRLLRRFSET